MLCSAGVPEPPLLIATATLTSAAASNTSVSTGVPVDGTASGITLSHVTATVNSTAEGTAAATTAVAVTVATGETCQGAATSLPTQVTVAERLYAGHTSATAPTAVAAVVADCALATACLQKA